MILNPADSRYRRFVMLLFGLFVTPLASCSPNTPISYQATPVSLSSPASPENIWTQAAVDFSNAYTNAEFLKSGPPSLKDLREVAVLISISDNFVQNTYSTDCKNDLIKRLRDAGLVVKENGESAIFLNVIGFWDDSASTATYMIEISFKKFAHDIRRGKHYLLFSTVWQSKRVCSVGRIPFPESFPQTVLAMENELINDWITANQ